MIQLFIAMLMALACPSHTRHTHGNQNQVTTLDDTGGETGEILPTPPPPQHP